MMVLGTIFNILARRAAVKLTHEDVDEVFIMRLVGLHRVWWTRCVCIWIGVAVVCVMVAMQIVGVSAGQGRVQQEGFEAPHQHHQETLQQGMPLLTSASVPR